MDQRIKFKSDCQMIHGYILYITSSMKFSGELSKNRIHRSLKAPGIKCQYTLHDRT